MPASTPAPTLILSAMPSEIRLIQAHIKRPKTGRLACFPYVTGVLRGRRVVTTVTGVGVTNAAMVTALFIREFKPAEVLVSGTGSRFNPRIETGDTIISTKTIHHAAGSLTQEGMVYRKVRGPLPGQMTHWYYKPDPRLLKLAKASIKGYTAEPVTANGRTYVPRVLTGVVTASDLFGVSDEKIADMKKKLNPDIMEMESAAIAQVCTQLGVPHLVFRAGSNRTQSNPGNDYRLLGQKAAHAAARWTVYFTGCLAEARA
ncbi:5'-methylthioadenosine/S-adenosylhomocysteine nucleosidase [Lacunisphaera limnophila]|uniref:adenosylhomocysteine nucleosidase n=1 Tax=Lacunisphaera limnophila TaxID=1838286 RepID=A0A1D8AVH6_9BACT|nr:5'-methylthioadenosine/S-adenosylhomocysteine nucleosidase [Lacunisphaera limnophila]AOS44856.1 5'-methylthioadenosine/S-adenosylhomocysteine nucleosidase [Lacunisphaera limnophila]